MNTQSFNDLIIPTSGLNCRVDLYEIDAATRYRLIQDALGYYRVPGRGYHGAAHPLRMLEAHRLYWNTDPTDALFLAILMHDAVYVPGQTPMSEEMSSHLLAPLYYRVTGKRIPRVLSDNVFELIRWTLPKFHVQDNRQKLSYTESLAARLLDLDLTSMSDDWLDFVNTQAQVEIEFAHTADHEDLVIASAGFLKTFVDKGFVYYTHERSTSNAKAIRNLKALVQAVFKHQEYNWESLAKRDPDELAAKYTP